MNQRNSILVDSKGMVELLRESLALFARSKNVLRVEWDGGVIQGKKRAPDPKDKKKR